MIDYNCLQWKTLVLFVHLGGKTMKTCEVCINNIVFFIYVYNMHNLIGWEHVDMQTNGSLLAHAQLCICYLAFNLQTHKQLYIVKVFQTS